MVSNELVDLMVSLGFGFATGDVLFVVGQVVHVVVLVAAPENPVFYLLDCFHWHRSSLSLKYGFHKIKRVSKSPKSRAFDRRLTICPLTFSFLKLRES